MESFVQIRHEYAAVIKIKVADETQYIYMLPSDMIIKKSLTISLDDGDLLGSFCQKTNNNNEKDKLSRCKRGCCGYKILLWISSLFLDSCCCKTRQKKHLSLDRLSFSAHYFLVIADICFYFSVLHWWICD